MLAAAPSSQFDKPLMATNLGNGRLVA